ncbi:unnamed protein product (macronuclear) [Paramecium tetraurelia]|uniref:Uncharacterized protein n=1 Tax=Paramecium tetraurelia TaxID=5888 RepID=A0BCH3_PARTE|nr:uncharacterized protein GSPATT00004334001 [Paramecium tetraurelia]CAK56240.1 unnamed protein product [Paramecium tetraurelia]
MRRNRRQIHFTSIFGTTQWKYWDLNGIIGYCQFENELYHSHN